jgi:hypothetical protein
VGTLFVIGIIVAILFVLAGTGVAVLLFAWFRHLWRDLRRTPVFGAQVARGANLARPVLAYRDVLSRAPIDATNLTLRIQRKAMALESVKEELGAEQRFRVEETTRRYLPDTMNAYRKTLAASDAQHTEASRLLVEQLSQLDANLDGIAAGASESALAALKANGHFLDELSAEVTGTDQALPGKEQQKPH